MAEPTRYVGVRRPRVDGREKVLGRSRYAGDIHVPGLLHARIVPSLYAHARIRAVDATRALGLPGVVAVLTASDLPIVGEGPERLFEPLARDEAVFAGQPIALVVAETDATAEDAAALVDVDVEELEPVVDVAAAAAPGAPLARALGNASDRRAEGTEQPAGAGDDEDGPSDAEGNVFARLRQQVGDVEAAFARSAVIVEGRFTSPWAHQAPIETAVATAWVEPDGSLAVSAAMQGTFQTRDMLAVLYGLPSSRIRVTAPPIGGGFGAKQVVIEPLVAGAALRLQAPVRLVLDRREDLAATTPSQAMVVDARIGVAADGRFEAVEATVTYDAGAFTEDSWHWYAHRLLTGPYRWAAYDVTAVGVRTNRFGVGNYRAPSGPQGCFALESLVDELAQGLGIDPIELRRRNVVAEGDPWAGGDTWPRQGATDCLDRLAAHPAWTGRAGMPRGEGVGVALAIWPGSMQPAAATCRLEPDGLLTVVTGAVDISGSASGFAVIAAEAFGVPVERVTVVAADTSAAPPSPASNASAITYATGWAVQHAAADARERLLEMAATELEIAAGDLEVVDGVVRPRGSPGAGRTVAELAATIGDSFNAPWRPVEGHAATAHTARAPSAAAHLAHVRVDAETGEVELLGYAIAQDVGRALNPDLVEGQMRGAVAQSIGRALYEELIHDERGQLLTGTLLDYALPRATMVPPIETLIVEVPAPEGPFGAKGMAEAPMVAGPAAIANAIAAATGLRLRELPMTAPRVWTALQEAGRSG